MDKHVAQEKTKSAKMSEAEAEVIQTPAAKRLSDGQQAETQVVVKQQQAPMGPRSMDIVQFLGIIGGHSVNTITPEERPYVSLNDQGDVNGMARLQKLQVAGALFVEELVKVGYVDKDKQEKVESFMKDVVVPKYEHMIEQHTALHQRMDNGKFDNRFGFLSLLGGSSLKMQAFIGCHLSLAALFWMFVTHTHDIQQLFKSNIQLLYLLSNKCVAVRSFFKSEGVNDDITLSDEEKLEISKTEIPLRRCVETLTRADNKYPLLVIMSL